MHFRTVIFIFISVLACSVNLAGLAGQLVGVSKGDQKSPGQLFTSEMFQDLAPELHALWLNPELGSRLGAILGHTPRTLRIKYYQQTNQTLWIFDEIGKVKPITIGVFIRASKIAAIRVLKFRESRGWEIKYSFFTDQFQHLGLTEKMQLSAPIDGITGATLSVAAMKRAARAALFLDQAVTGAGHLLEEEAL